MIINNLLFYLVLISFNLTFFSSLSIAKDFKVGLVYTESDWNHFQKGVDPLKNYTSMMQIHHVIIVPLHLGPNEIELDKTLNTLSGIIFPGGDDKIPFFYEDQRTATVEFDFNILKKAEALNIPIMGICRGLQLINVFHHGELYKNVSSELGKTVIHRKILNHKSLPTYHMINLLKEHKSIEVNSYHFQGIKTLGRDLSITAKSTDGLIEAYDSSSTQFIMAVQFHPEKEQNPGMNQFTDKFFDHLKSPIELPKGIN